MYDVHDGLGGRQELERFPSLIGRGDYAKVDHAWSSSSLGMASGVVRHAGWAFAGPFGDGEARRRRSRCPALSLSRDIEPGPDKLRLTIRLALVHARPAGSVAISTIPPRCMS
jgi:hypothetical protein